MLQNGEARIMNIFKLGFKAVSKNSKKVRSQYNSAISRSLHITGVSAIGNTLIGLGKIISGVLGLSVFTCVNGFYTLGMVFARYCALLGVVKSRDSNSQYKYYFWTGLILIIASMLYVSYSGWAYFRPKYVEYNKYIALTIATFTFAEIALNIRGVIINRKNKSPLIHAIKTINLASSVISLVLTQAALLTFAGNNEHNPAVNALLGIFTGIVAAFLGVYMILRINYMKDKSKKRH